MNKLDILKRSLDNKEARFEEKLGAHFASVAQANGQPLNDKRNGAATVNQWDRQNGTLRKLNEGIELTKKVIAEEEHLQSFKQAQREALPPQLVALMDSGELTQWLKHPSTFFVAGVKKARIVWDAKKKELAHKYVGAITDKDEYKKFAQLFNSLNAALYGNN